MKKKEILKKPNQKRKIPFYQLFINFNDAHIYLNIHVILFLKQDKYFFTYDSKQRKSTKT